MKTPLLKSVFALPLALLLALTLDASAEETAKNPKDACSKLVEAAKKNDFESAKKLMVWGGPHHDKKMGRGKGAKAEARFHKMHENNLSRIKEISCGSEQVAGDHAIVLSEGKDEKRLIPFVQESGQWKFDARTYMSFYREDRKKQG